MIRSRFLLLAALLAAATPALARRRATAPPPIPEAAAIATIVQAELDRGLPGMAVAVARGETIYFSAGYGSMNLQGTRPATPDSIFQVGSVTKQFTAAAILRLEEEGKLRVGDPIEKWLPKLGGRNIRIEHLLNHSAGLVWERAFLDDAYETVPLAKLIDEIAARPQEFPAGTRYEYRNTGYYALAAVIEAVSGMRYAEYLEQTFFKPLGLTQTGVCGSKAAVPVPDGHVRVAAGGALFVEQVRAADMSLLVGAGDICSTAHDLIRWNRALVTGRAVSRASYERMSAPSPLPTGYSFRYGYGLIVDNDRGNPVVLHDGLVLGFQSVLIYYPQQDLTIAVLANAIDDKQEWVPATITGLRAARLFVPAK